MKRVLLLMALALLVVGAIFVRGRARPLAPVDGEIRDLVATSHGVFWISAPDEPGSSPATVWCVPTGAHRPVAVLRAYDVRSIFVTGATLYALAESGPELDSGELVVRELATGQEKRHGGLHAPQGLWVDPSATYWTEARSERAPAIVHIPIIRPIHALRKTTSDPSQATLVALMEGSKAHFTGTFLGRREEKLYWTEQIGTEFSQGAAYVRREGPPSGDIETLSRERGPNFALLNGDDLFWTAYSHEMAIPSAGRIVYRLNLAHGGSAKITDWLSASGALTTDGDTVYFVGGDWVWALPSKLDEPTPVQHFAANRPGTVDTFNSNVYGRDTWDEEPHIVRRPLSWRGVLTAALQFGSTDVAPDTSSLGGEAL